MSCNGSTIFVFPPICAGYWPPTYIYALLPLFFITTPILVAQLTPHNWHVFKDEILIVLGADGESSGSACPRTLARLLKASKKLPRHLETVEQYVQEVSDLKDQLTALGEEISDNYFKDVLLATSIHSTSASVTRLLDNLEAKCHSGATYIKPDGDIVKSEPEDTALATRVGGGRKVFASSGMCSRWSRGIPDIVLVVTPLTLSAMTGIVWVWRTKTVIVGAIRQTRTTVISCDRRNHIAARCVADMPKEIKTWILDRPGAHERSNAVRETYCGPPGMFLPRYFGFWRRLKEIRFHIHVGIRYEASL
ncbi:hypothetical protein B0H14DRAFT_2626377 [Mycena olivaceomarginata]|nr:hypothetical protein B0H14DRAFT_2626377 [Mycena olivaceomarginata]